MRKIPPLKAQFIFLIIILSSQISYGENTASQIRDSRYTIIKPGATESQKNLLKTIVRLQVPENIQTIGQVLKYLIEPYGYQLDTEAYAPPEQYLLFRLPLPKPHRTLGPMTLQEAITTLGGKSFTAQLNPVTRTLSYQLKENYRRYIENTDLEQAKTQWLSSKKQEPRNDTAQQNLPPKNQQYGPVKPGETLSQIITYFKLEGATVNQALLHIYQANTDAFANANMSHLRVGAILTIPPFHQAMEIPEKEARNLVNRHYQLWLGQGSQQ